MNEPGMIKSGRRHRVLLAAVFVAVLGLLVMALSFGATPSMAADPSATLTKEALDPAGNPISNGASLPPGSPIKWVLNYDNTSGTPAHAVVTDPIGAGQSFVAGSLQTPPAWTKEYSADGATFGSTDLGAGTAAVRSQGDVPSTSTGAAVPVPPPLTSIFQDSATGGDGFRPILFGNDVFNIFHHTLQGGQQIVACTNSSTGEPCPGYPKTLSYGAPPQTVSTSFTPMQFVRSDGKMFFPAQLASRLRGGLFRPRCWYAVRVHAAFHSRYRRRGGRQLPGDDRGVGGDRDVAVLLRFGEQRRGPHPDPVLLRCRHPGALCQRGESRSEHTGQRHGGGLEPWRQRRGQRAGGPAHRRREPHLSSTRRSAGPPAHR